MEMIFLLALSQTPCQTCFPMSDMANQASCNFAESIAFILACESKAEKALNDAHDEALDQVKLNSLLQHFLVFLSAVQGAGR